MAPKYQTFGKIRALHVPGSGPYYIILFHGYGSNPKDLFSLSQLSQKYHWIFPEGRVEIPFSPFYTGRAWFPLDMEKLQRSLAAQNWSAFEDSLKEATTYQKELQEFLQALDIPLDKCILGGFSQGAIVAIELLLSAKEKMAGLILLSGTLIHEKKWKKLLPAKQGTPFFQCHGIEDPLLPYSLAKQLAGILQDSGFKGHMFAFPGGHELTRECLSELQAFLRKF